MGAANLARQKHPRIKSGWTVAPAMEAAQDSILSSIGYRDKKHRPIMAVRSHCTVKKLVLPKKFEGASDAGAM